MRRKKLPPLADVDWDKIPIPRPKRGRPRIYPHGIMQAQTKMEREMYIWLKCNFGSISKGVHVAVDMMRRILDEEYK